MIRTRRLELLERHSQTTGITQWEGVPLRAAFRVMPATRPGAVPVPGIHRKRPRP